MGGFVVVIPSQGELSALQPGCPAQQKPAVKRLQLSTQAGFDESSGTLCLH